MRTIRVVFVGVLLSLAIFCAGAEQDVSDSHGLPVGAAAPRFTLIEQTGKEVSLEALLQKGPVAVVFHRSVDWCALCKLQMVELQRISKEIEAAGGQVVAISYDSREKLKDYARRQKIKFPLLADVGSKTIEAYGVRYPDAPAEMSGFARHATFIVDQKGMIRSKLYRVGYRERSAIDTLINSLKDARKPTTAGETKS